MVLIYFIFAINLCIAIAIPSNYLNNTSTHQESSTWNQSSEVLEDSKNIEHFDGFISYRRSASRHLAMLLKVMLSNKNVSAYLDVEDLDGGFWDVQLMQNIETSPNFILVLSNGTLERCKGDFNYTDFLHREIKEAVNFNKRIIPVFDDFDWPPSELFSEEINTALSNQGIDWVHSLVDQSLERLINYMLAPGPKPNSNNNMNIYRLIK